MDTEITKKVELLRALLRTKDQFDELIDTGANDEFTDKDKEFMEEFKKIYDGVLGPLYGEQILTLDIMQKY